MDAEEFIDLEDDGMDPGLSESAYDGAEYEMDSFGERIGEDDLTEESMSEDEMLPEKPADGFGETLIAEPLEDEAPIEDSIIDETAPETTTSDLDRSDG